MNCKNIQNNIAAYQSDELDYFKKKSFENHIKKCPACRKKYAGLVAVSMLMFASDKTRKENIAKAILGTAAVKAILSILMIGAFAVSSYYAIDNFVSLKTPANLVSRGVIAEEVEDSGLGKSLKNNITTEVTSGAITTTEGKLKIISSSDNKEAEIILDSKTFEVLKRKE